MVEVKRVTNRHARGRNVRFVLPESARVGEVNLMLLPRYAAIALVSVGMTGCFSSECSHVPNVHTVVPGVLIRGGQPTKRGLRELRDDHGIRTVVNFNDLT